MANSADVQILLGLKVGASRELIDQNLRSIFDELKKRNYEVTANLSKSAYNSIKDKIANAVKEGFAEGVRTGGIANIKNINTDNRSNSSAISSNGNVKIGSGKNASVNDIQTRVSDNKYKYISGTILELEEKGVNEATLRSLRDKQSLYLKQKEITDALIETHAENEKINESISKEINLFKILEERVKTTRSEMDKRSDNMQLGSSDIKELNKYDKQYEELTARKKNLGNVSVFSENSEPLENAFKVLQEKREFASEMLKTHGSGSEEFRAALVDIGTAANTVVQELNRLEKIKAKIETGVGIKKSSFADEKQEKNTKNSVADDILKNDPQVAVLKAAQSKAVSSVKNAIKSTGDEIGFDEASKLQTELSGLEIKLTELFEKIRSGTPLEQLKEEFTGCYEEATKLADKAENLTELSSVDKINKLDSISKDQYKKKIDSLKDEGFLQGGSDVFTGRLSEITQHIEKLKLMLSERDVGNGFSELLKQTQVEINSFGKDLYNFDAQMSKFDNVQYKKIMHDAETALDWKASKHGNTLEQYQAIEKARKDIEDAYKVYCANTKDTANIRKTNSVLDRNMTIIDENRKAIEAAGEAHDSFGGKIKKTGVSILQSMGKYQLFRETIQQIKQMATAAIEIDKSMTQLKIVTGATDGEMEKFLTNSTALAKELGQSITDVLGAVETFSRLGYNLEEASTLSKYTGIMSNVAGVSSEEATTGVTSIIKGFGMDVSNSEHVSDVLVSVGQKYAVSASELMEAFEKCGAALNATNTSFEKSAGLIAAANASVQNSSTVGTALKTVSARIRGSKSDLSELGEDGSDLADGFSKYQAEIQALTGFNIMKPGTTNQFQDIFDIFDGLSKVWDKLSDTQQSRVSEILGGTRQLQVISSILSNWGDATNAYATAMDSAGVSTSAEATYMDSINGHLQVMKTTWQELSANLMDGDVLKGIIDIGTALLNVGNVIVKITDAVGGLKTLMISIAGVFTIKQFGNGFKNTFQSLKDFAWIIKNSQNMQDFSAGWSALGRTSKVGIITSIVTTVASAVTSIIHAYNEHQEKLKQGMLESAKGLVSNQQDLENYKQKFVDLRTEINSGTLSTAELVTKKQELANIQNELCEKFGDEANGLKLVTGAIEEQKDAIDALDDSDLQEFYQTNQSNGQIKKARKKIYDIDASVGGFTGVKYAYMDDVDEIMRQNGFSAIRESTNKFTTMYQSIGVDAREAVNNIQNAIDQITDYGIHKFGASKYMDEVGSAITTLTKERDKIQQNVTDYGDVLEKVAQYKLQTTETDEKSGERAIDKYRELTQLMDEYKEASANFDVDKSNELRTKIELKSNELLQIDDIDIQAYVTEKMTEWQRQLEQQDFVLRVKAKIDAQVVVGGGDPDNGENTKSMRDGLISQYGDENGVVKISAIKDAILSSDAEKKKWDSFAKSLGGDGWEQALGALVAIGDAIDDIGMFATEATHSFKALSKSYEDLKSISEATSKAQQMLGGEIKNGTILTDEMYSTLTTAVGGEENLKKAMSDTSDHMVTNVDLLKKMVDATNLLAQHSVKLAQANTALKYQDVANEMATFIRETTKLDSEKKHQLSLMHDELDMLDMELGRYSLLQAQLQGVTDGYTKYEAAKSYDSEMDYSTKTQDVLVTAYNGFKYGGQGSEAYDAAIDVLIPLEVRYDVNGDRISPKDAEKYLKEHYKGMYTVKTKNTGNDKDTMNDLYEVSITRDNVNAFVKNGMGKVFDQSADGSFNLRSSITDMKQFADILGITEEMAFTYVTLIDKFSTSSDGGTLLDTLMQDDDLYQIKQMSDELEGLVKKKEALLASGKETGNVDEQIGGKQKELLDKESGIATNVTKSAMTQSKMSEKELALKIQQKEKALEGAKKELMKKGFSYKQIEATSSIRDMESSLKNLKSLKESLIYPSEADITIALDYNEKQIQDAVSKISTLVSYDKETGEYTLNADVNFDNLSDEEKQAWVQLSSSQEVNKTIKAVFLDNTDESTYSTLENIENFEIHDKKFVVHCNSETALNKIEEVKTALETLNGGAEVEIKVNKSDSGSSDSGGGNDEKGSKNNGTHGGTYSGNMHVNGTIGAQTSEHNALVGELGQELFVDPRTGRYHTVGDNGAELVDLPKGAIIFNHRQTEQLLKNKRISTRGKALASGNAYAMLRKNAGDELVYSKPQPPTRTSRHMDDTFTPTVNVVGSATNTSAGKIKDSVEELEEAFEELIRKLKHEILIMQKLGKPVKDIAAVYKKMMDAAHAQAEKYRKLGKAEDSKEIQELQEKWWEFKEARQQAILDDYGKQITKQQNAVTQFEYELENAIRDKSVTDMEIYAQSYMDMQNSIVEKNKEAMAYLKTQGYKDGSAELAEYQQKVNEASNAIVEMQDKVKETLKQLVTDANSEVDNLQDTFSAFQTMAEEFSKNGFISIDSFQKMTELGPSILYFIDEQNGKLVINKKRIEEATKAKIQDLTVQTALSYVQQIEDAANAGQIDTLNQLIFCQGKEMTTTMGLCRAKLTLLKTQGKLSKEYEAEAQSTLDKLEMMANNTMDHIGDSLGDKSDVWNDLIKYTMDMLDKRLDKEKDALNDMKDTFSDMIDLRKEALDDAKRESDYEEEVADKIKEIAKLQDKIGLLSNDTSRKGISERKKAQEELDKLQKELNDYQADYAVDRQKETLDRLNEDYGEQKDTQLEDIDEITSSYQKKFDIAIQYMQDHWNTLYKELETWNNEYGSDLTSQITKAWNDCIPAVEKYGNVVKALLNNGYTLEKGHWGTTSSSETIGSTSSSSGSTNDGTISMQDEIEQARQREYFWSVVETMYQNSEQWRNADPSTAAGRATRKLKDEENLDLGAMLSAQKWGGLTAVRGKKSDGKDKDGVWYLDHVGGTKLYDAYNQYLQELSYKKYHTGGIVGGNGSLRQNEVLTVLEKGEAVLDRQKEKSLYSIVGMASVLSKKLGGSINGKNGIDSLLTLGQSMSQSMSKTVGDIHSGQRIEINFGDTIINGANENTVAQHKAVMRDFANEIFSTLNIRR